MPYQAYSGALKRKYDHVIDVNVFFLCQDKNIITLEYQKRTFNKFWICVCVIWNTIGLAGTCSDKTYLILISLNVVERSLLL